jgi:hypothetical protein
MGIPRDQNCDSAAVGILTLMNTVSKRLTIGSIDERDARARAAVAKELELDG